MLRLIDRGGRGRAGAPFCAIEKTERGHSIGENGPTGPLRRWLRGVPWRHLWILAAVILLLLFALLGWFPNP